MHPPPGVTAGRLTPVLRRRSRSLALAAAVALYVLLPSLLAVFGSWHSLEHLDWPFAVLVLGCETASSVCLWELDRLALRTAPGGP